MRLTKENAHLYEGKTLDAEKRLWHHYPLQVKRNGLGELKVVDITDTWIEIPDEKDLFNRIDFDFVTDTQENKIEKVEDDK